MAAVMLLSWIVLIAVVYAVVRVGTDRPSATVSDPVKVLDQRLARGDIDPDDYRLRRQLLADRTPTDRSTGLTTKPG
ncbi:MAG: SHOCT domain-containing protein [Jatrophihabitantaceae bacterium]